MRTVYSYFLNAKLERLARQITRTNKQLVLAQKSAYDDISEGEVDELDQALEALKSKLEAIESRLAQRSLIA